MASKRAVRYLSQADTRALLAWPEVIACLRAAYASADDPRAAPPKVVARKDGMWLRALTAISGSGGAPSGAGAPPVPPGSGGADPQGSGDRKSTRLNSSH